MIPFKVNGEAVYKVGTAISNTVSEYSDIEKLGNNIDAGLVSEYSSSATSGVEEVVSKVSTLIEDLNNLETSYTLAKGELDALIAENKRILDEGLNSLKAKSSFLEKEEAAKANIAFYFNYPEAAREVKKISPEKMAYLLEKNGATKVNDGAYEITINGSRYHYNVKSCLISEVGKKYRIYATYYATEDADFNDITNTIAIMGGSGNVNSNHGTRDFYNGIKADKKSLIILPYGETINNADYLIAGSTRLGNAMVGNNKKTSNSIIGYSLGGLLAARTVSQNKGLYNNLVFVNSGIYSSDLGANVVERYGTYENFKDTKIIFFEGEGDKFVNSAYKTVESMISNGVPKDNFYIYTNDTKLLTLSSKLGSDHVVAVPEEYRKSHKGWRGHSYGNNMIKESNIVNYLSIV